MRWERAVQQCTALSFSLSNPTQGVPPLEIPGAGPCNNVIKPRKSERRILRLGRQELNKGESKPAFRTQGGAEQCSFATSVASFSHSPWAVPGLVAAEPAVRLSASRARGRGLQAWGALSVVASLILTRQ
jgi:hypothetical protein